LNPIGHDPTWRRVAFAFRPVIYRDARREIRARLRRQPHHVPLVVDIGGRRSPYTSGLPARLVLTDRPPAGEQQEHLRLGLTPAAARDVLARRNLLGVVLNDATTACFRAGVADGVIAVEVLEHVEDDESFVAEVARILDTDGWFVMTTPNGDAKPDPTNPDHVRHYRRHDLAALLQRWFDDVDVRYAVVMGRWHRLGLRGWDARRPVTTLLSMLGNTVNGLQSRPRRVMNRTRGTNHLVAVARRPRRRSEHAAGPPPDPSRQLPEQLAPQRLHR